MQVKMIADLFLQGMPIRTIERTMTKKGYRHKHGEWEAKTVRRVLQNPVNIGMIKNRDQWYKGLHEPILDQNTFDAIQKLMEKRREEYGTARAHQSLLGGILYCKNCGGRYARQNLGGVFYYTCYSRSKKMKKMIKDPNCRNKNYRMEDLENAILHEIHLLAIDPNRVEQVRENRPVSDVSEKIKAITSEIAKIDTQISKMMDLYALGTIDLDVISDKVAALNGQKAALSKELESLNVPKTDTMTTQEVMDIASLMQDDLPLEDKRNIVQSLIYFIEIDEDDVIIHWKF